MFSQLLQDFIHTEQLPATYAEDAQRYLLPLAESLLAHVASNTGKPLVIGINGAQGTGKSTLAALLSHVFTAQQLSVANLSIDDFYLSHADRAALGESCHPLLASRGVPGTHDTTLLLATIAALQNASSGEAVTLPRFDKSCDDCVDLDECPTVVGPLDVIILEGWFVGVTPQADSELANPINSLEESEDSDGRWRRYVNEQLAGDYQTVFAAMEYLILLQAPSFEQVFEWRSLQEAKLRQRSAKNAPGLMDDAQIARFIQHFERLTRWCLATLPGRADVVLEMDAAHRIVRCID